VRFTPEEAGRLVALSASPPPLGPAARAAVLQAERQELAESQAERLRGALDRPVVPLPLLAAERWGRRAVERIADAMAGHV
jgi:hypothetical protein